jgi:hypothetical protein
MIKELDSMELWEDPNPKESFLDKHSILHRFLVVLAIIGILFMFIPLAIIGVIYWLFTGEDADIFIDAWMDFIYGAFD